MRKSTNLATWVPLILMFFLTLAGGLLLARYQLAGATRDPRLRQALAERPRLPLARTAVAPPGLATKVVRP